MKWLVKLMTPFNKSHMPVLIKFCFRGTDFLGVSICARECINSRHWGRRVVRDSLSLAEDLYTHSDLCCSPHHAKSPAGITSHWTELDVNLLNERLIDRRGVYGGQPLQTRRIADNVPGQYQPIHITHRPIQPSLSKIHFVTMNIKNRYA